MSQWNPQQQRFLAAYTDIRTVAGACRLAQVHRSTVYRWIASNSWNHQALATTTAEQHRAGAPTEQRLPDAVLGVNQPC